MAAYYSVCVTVANCVTNTLGKDDKYQCFHERNHSLVAVCVAV